MRSLRTEDAVAAKGHAGARQRPGKAALGVVRCGCYVRGMEYGILGPLAVWRDGRELELGAGKQRALLAILLLHAGETMAVPRLVDALWDERPPATAVKALQVYVSQLRKVLGEGVLETRPLGYV